MTTVRFLLTHGLDILRPLPPPGSDVCLRSKLSLEYGLTLYFDMHQDHSQNIFLKVLAPGFTTGINGVCKRHCSLHVVL